MPKTVLLWVADCPAVFLRFVYLTRPNWTISIHEIKWAMSVNGGAYRVLGYQAVGL